MRHIWVQDSFDLRIPVALNEMVLTTCIRVAVVRDHVMEHHTPPPRTKRALLTRVWEKRSLSTGPSGNLLGVLDSWTVTVESVNFEGSAMLEIVLFADMSLRKIYHWLYFSGKTITVLHQSCR